MRASSFGEANELGKNMRKGNDKEQNELVILIMRVFSSFAPKLKATQKRR